jgi:spermidine/putrescine transport system permease protein
LFFLVIFPLSLVTVVIGHTTLTMAFAYFILSIQVRRLDPALLEAALDLGASQKEVRGEIILPWLKTSIISSFALCFLLSFDDFLISYFVSGVGQDTLPIKLFSMLKMGISPTINALSVLILLFTLISFFICYPFLRNLNRSGAQTRKREMEVR